MSPNYVRVKMDLYDRNHSKVGQKHKQSEIKDQ